MAMDMYYFDGFDWPGDASPEHSVAKDNLSRGWFPFGDVQQAVIDPSPIWTSAERTPIGKALHLTGSPASYIAHSTRHYIDNAIGLHMRFDAIPDGLVKCIEFLEWTQGAFAVRYTLYIYEGRFALYHGAAPIGVGDNPIDLEAATNYSIHLYCRRNYRTLFVNGIQVMEFTTTYAKEYINSVRIYVAGGVVIDDLYLGWGYDGRYPWSWLNGDDLIKHKVLTLKPIQEVDNEWATLLYPFDPIGLFFNPSAPITIPGGYASDDIHGIVVDDLAVASAILYSPTPLPQPSLVVSLNGSDETYQVNDIQHVSRIGVKMTRVNYPMTEKAFHIQGHVRCVRNGPITQLFHIEGLTQAISYETETLPDFLVGVIISPIIRTVEVVHEDTHAMTAGLDLHPALSWHTCINKCSSFWLDLDYRTAETINTLLWFLRIIDEHPYLSQTTDLATLYTRPRPLGHAV